MLQRHNEQRELEELRGSHPSPPGAVDDHTVGPCLSSDPPQPARGDEQIALLEHATNL
jgi:hypothetical protein